MIQRLMKWVVLGVAFVLVAGASAYFTVLFVIKGEDRVVVPDLIGKDVVQILETLSRLGLNTKVKEPEHNDQIPAHHVLSQYPSPGTEIKKGRDVRIVLSKGPRMLLAPNLKGLPLRQARIILEQNGLCIGNISKVYHSNALNEAILAQSPDRGAELTQNRCMDLLVSLGPRPRTLKMPDLMGLSFSEAVLVAQRMNLVLGPNQVAEEQNQPEGAVLGQEPSTGYPIFEGSVVKLIRNHKKDRAKSAPGFAPKGIALFKHRIKNGFLKTRIQLKFYGYGLSGELIDSYMDPGEEVMLLIPEDAEAFVSLYEDDALVVSKEFKP